MKRERIGGIALLCLGILTLGTGTYFLFFRPALLPEDIRFTGVDPRLIDPRMAAWLRIVFRTWGGFLTGFGILLTAVAGNLLSARQGVLRWGAAAAVLVAFGQFFVSNFQLRSDHLPFIAGLFTIAAVAAGLLMSRRRRGREGA
jgi:hypothetical protein